jgi:hypothetical protein
MHAGGPDGAEPFAGGGDEIEGLSTELGGFALGVPNVQATVAGGTPYRTGVCRQAPNVRARLQGASRRANTGEAAHPQSVNVTCKCEDVLVCVGVRDHLIVR